MQRISFLIKSLLGLLTFSIVLNATTINFEGLPDGTNLSSQYVDFSITNAIVLQAGVSLNELEFPPHSGVNVISDNGGPITIDFLIPVNSLQAYFTYAEPLTVAAYDSSNNLLATATSHYSNNELISGDFGSSPNELIELSTTSSISSITFTADPLGYSFVADDLTYSYNPTPEPSYSVALAISIASVLWYARRRCATQLLVGKAIGYAALRQPFKSAN